MPDNNMGQLIDIFAQRQHQLLQKRMVDDQLKQNFELAERNRQQRQAEMQQQAEEFKTRMGMTQQEMHQRQQALDQRQQEFFHTGQLQAMQGLASGELREAPPSTFMSTPMPMGGELNIPQPPKGGMFLGGKSVEAVPQLQRDIEKQKAISEFSDQERQARHKQWMDYARVSGIDPITTMRVGTEIQFGVKPDSSTALADLMDKGISMITSNDPAMKAKGQKYLDAVHDAYYGRSQTPGAGLQIKLSREAAATKIIKERSIPALQSSGREINQANLKEQYYKDAAAAVARGEMDASVIDVGANSLSASPDRQVNPIDAIIGQYVEQLRKNMAVPPAPR